MHVVYYALRNHFNREGGIMKVGHRLLAVLILLLSFGGCEVEEESYLVIAQHNLDSFGSTTQVEVYKGFANGISGADVTINGVPVPETAFFVPYYTGSDLSANSPGDSVTIRVVVGGEELMNRTLTLPSSLVTIDSCPDPFDVSVNQTVTWSGGTGCDQYRPYISFGNTVSGEDYEPIIASSTFSHVIPANTVEYDAVFDFFSLEVHAQKTASLGGSLASGSTFTVSTYDWVMPTTIP
jgi:hypothetical protein